MGGCKGGSDVPLLPPPHAPTTAMANRSVRRIRGAGGRGLVMGTFGGWLAVSVAVVCPRPPAGGRRRCTLGPGAPLASVCFLIDQLGSFSPLCPPEPPLGKVRHILQTARARHPVLLHPGGRCGVRFSPLHANPNSNGLCAHQRLKGETTIEAYADEPALLVHPVGTIASDAPCGRREAGTCPSIQTAASSMGRLLMASSRVLE